MTNKELKEKLANKTDYHQSVPLALEKLQLLVDADETKTNRDKGDARKDGVRRKKL